MSRPLIISDCDEVLMHMVVPFRTWLSEHHDIDFSFSGGFEQALRSKTSGDPVARKLVWALLDSFFETEMHRQSPIAGAVAAMTRLAEHGDIVILTNIGEEKAPARAAQIHACGMPYRVIGNRGGKGPAVSKLVDEYRPSVLFFIDDLGANHASVAQDVPQCWRLHMVGEPELAPHVESSLHAHGRIDDWSGAEHWIMSRIEDYQRIARESADA